MTSVARKTGRLKALGLATRVILAAFLTCATTAPVQAADAPMQPPMNDFNDAYYSCDGTAFLISYDSETPTKAKLTTSSHNKEYELTRTQSPSGVAFEGGAVRFWTDGKTVTVAGTPEKFTNCKRKAQ
jgi:membrane-bound inhibitor of C-type lysozyme